MENIPNKNIKVSSPLPFEMLSDLIKAANITNIIINNYNIKKTTVELKWKELATKFATSSLIIYAFGGKNLRKMFRRFKVMFIKMCLDLFPHVKNINIPSLIVQTAIHNYLSLKFSDQIGLYRKNNPWIKNFHLIFVPSRSNLNGTIRNSKIYAIRNRLNMANI
uniref:Uncharacterized protein n=1 Tax=Meloidogyne hapla TaxID=6305 RepID=A0A1I8AZ66_MELHA